MDSVLRMIAVMVVGVDLMVRVVSTQSGVRMIGACGVVVIVRRAGYRAREGEQQHSETDKKGSKERHQNSQVTRGHHRAHVTG